MPQRVDLKSVHYFTWTCPDCKTENRHNGRVCRDEHAIKEIAEEFDEEFKVGDLMVFPSQVACVKCEGVFATRDPDGGDEWKDGVPPCDVPND